MGTIVEVMAQITISKGLDIPIKGHPEGSVQELTHRSGAAPKTVALNLEGFDLKFHLLAKTGDRVKIGEPIAEDKMCPGRLFVAPGSGTILEIQRGLKRALKNVIIQLDPQEEYHPFSPFEWEKATREELLQHLKKGGIFAKIRMRPFDLLADPRKHPKHIFVKALESAPFVPPAEMQVQGFEKAFELGLKVLGKLTDGKVHLVYREGSLCRAFNQAKDVVLHTASGPHPISNASVHIQQISPIGSLEDMMWTLNAHDVTCIGHLVQEGKIRIDRVVSIAGPGISSGQTGYFRLREGYPISSLLAGRLISSPIRLISGDPLMGRQVLESDFLGMGDYCFTAIPENTSREFLHFFRAGADKYSFSRAYLSGHFDNTDRLYDFTTSLHGEHRAFVDNTLYDKVQPLPISTIHLIKAILAEDFEFAEELGLLAVAPEDFALPTFVCPSKNEMSEIVKQGLARYAHDSLT